MPVAVYCHGASQAKRLWPEARPVLTADAGCHPGAAAPHKFQRLRTRPGCNNQAAEIPTLLEVTLCHPLLSPVIPLVAIALAPSHPVNAQTVGEFVQHKLIRWGSGYRSIDFRSLPLSPLPGVVS